MDLDQNRNNNFDVLWQKFAALQLTARGSSLSLFLLGLDESNQMIALRLCLLVYKLTKGQEIPKELQLEAALASIKTH